MQTNTNTNTNIISKKKMTDIVLAHQSTCAVDSEHEASEEDPSESHSSALKSLHSQSGTTETGVTSSKTTEDTATLAETQAVNRSKKCLLAALCVAAIGATTLTYFLARQQQYDELNKQFSVNVYEIEDSVTTKWHSAQVAIENLATSIASAAVASRQDLTSFKMPFFKQHAHDVTELSSGARAVGWAPVVILPNDGGVTLPIAQLGTDSADDDFLTDFIANFNLLAQDGDMGELFLQMVVSSEQVQTGLRPLDFLGTVFNTTNAAAQDNTNIEDQQLHTMMLQPIINGTSKEAPYKPIVAGVAFSILSWETMFQHVAAPGSGKTLIVLEDSCGGSNTQQQLTYQVDGETATFVGYGDRHQDSFDDMHDMIRLTPSSSSSAAACEYKIHVYATQSLANMYVTNTPWIYACIVLAVMITFIAAFVIYDRFVQNRQERVLAKAARSNAIVASLFPANVRDRIMKDAEEQVSKGGKNNKLGSTGKNQLKNYLDGQTTGDDDNKGSKPIADLFPATTVMFGDIAGFTAWSSIREPCQVFQLLETLYNSFDEIAKRRRVYKVETIGDCYVAVAGLPEPRKDHATVMTRFARDILKTMHTLTTKLEVELGPDTGDLAMRIGLHSGPVTAGVLRGNNCRFQLFGDTVNVAARMESNGQRNSIHISEDTANLLILAGKEDWLIPREDKIVAKGKGLMTTFFINMRKNGSGAASVTSASSGSQGKSDLGGFSKVSGGTGTGLPSRIRRLVTFNADLLGRLLKAVVARRDAEILVQGRSVSRSRPPLEKRSSSRANGGTVLDEVVEILTLPKFNAKAAMKQQDPKDVILAETVMKQIHEYVTVLATMYRRDVPFHNFEHASHVTMSVTKLLSRIVAPDSILSSEDANQDELIKQLHEHTYGITSDPMTQFAAVLAALIHDVDHSGLPNSQLIKENSPLAAAYRGKSIAEQNSVDIAWDLLMEENFKDLRAVIYTTEAEEKHFRSLLVNLVLATDICDKELGAARKDRWAKAFDGNGSASNLEESEHDSVNRKATIVLEHLIQASDVAHTMQHWHIYRKWNEKFFEENMKAYRGGRAEKDPALYWYEGELGFFDFYIIPLAKKLKECGVFGVSSDEYLDYALKNRKEWELMGQDIVNEMLAKFMPVLMEEEEELSCHEDLDDSEGGSFDSTSALNLDQEHIFNVTGSWEMLRRIENYEEKTGTILFAVLFQKCPPAKVLFGFPINMDPTSDTLTKSKRFLMHARYMVQMLDKALQLIGPDSEVLAQILADLGKKHVRLGVKEDFFPIMGEALLEALNTLLGSHLTTEMKESWGIVYEALSSEMIRSMNNDKAVLYSWNRLKSIENYQEVAGALLFQRLFAQCPDAKILFGFPADMDINSEQMLSSTRFKTHAAYFIEMLDRALGMVEAKEIGDNMKRLGAMHSQFGVKEEYFAIMGESLFATLEDVLKSAWTSAAEEAWRNVYGRLASQMIEAMNEANEASESTNGRKK